MDGDSTIAVHEGEGPDPLARPIHAPLYGSVTYEFESAAALERYLHDPSRGYIYTRWGNPTARAVEAKLAALLGAEEARVYASGMGAIAAAALGLAAQGSRIVHAGSLYGGTWHLLHDFLPRFGVGVESVPAGDAAALERALAGDGVAFLYCETISNPTVRVADLDALAAAARARGVPLVADNTFATAHVCRPLERGATLVIESATKGLSGHADLMAGVLAGPRALVETIDRGTARYLGVTVGAFEAWLLARGIRTFSLRLERACANAAALAAALAGDPRVAAVAYPGLPSHPDHAIARRILREGRFGSVLAFDLGTPARARAFYDAVQVFRRAASLGSVESLVALPVLSSHFGIPPGELAALGVSPGLVRLSVGIEDEADLVADVRRALAIAASA